MTIIITFALSPPCPFFFFYPFPSTETAKAKIKTGQDSTYGGLKNCSIATYMPLNISVKRKYRPFLSSACSSSWSQVLGVGMRKPLGGGPAGVAYVRMAWETKDGAMMARRVVSWRATTAAAEGAVVVN